MENNYNNDKADKNTVTGLQSTISTLSSNFSTFQNGVSTIVAAINSKCGSNHSSTDAPSTIAATVNNITINNGIDFNQLTGTDNVTNDITATISTGKFSITPTETGWYYLVLLSQIQSSTNDNLYFDIQGGDISYSTHITNYPLVSAGNHFCGMFFDDNICEILFNYQYGTSGANNLQTKPNLIIKLEKDIVYTVTGHYSNNRLGYSDKAIYKII